METRPGEFTGALRLDSERAIAHIVDWLRAYAQDAGVNGFVVGVSGGIDSAVTSLLCAKTGLQTHVVDMPIHQAADQASRSAGHIEDLRERFPETVRPHFVDLTGVFDAFAAAMPRELSDESGGLALANSRARLRMATLYTIGQKAGVLVAGTGNKVEDFGVGFYTKYGDGGVDLSPIADLMKTEVFAIGQALGVRADILNAAPTDGLWGDDRTDEDQLGASYHKLEWAMRTREAWPEGAPADASSRERDVLAIYDRFHRANRHKMVPIPVCKLPESLRS
jgi:NAD+ synthase